MERADPLPPPLPCTNRQLSSRAHSVFSFCPLIRGRDMYAYYSLKSWILQQWFSFSLKKQAAFVGKIDIPRRIMYNMMLLIMSAETGHPTLKKRR